MTTVAANMEVKEVQEYRAECPFCHKNNYILVDEYGTEDSHNDDTCEHFANFSRKRGGSFEFEEAE